MKVLIIGSGAIGSVIGRILQSRPEFEEIILADLKQETAQRMIGNLTDPAKLTAIAMNANNIADMKKGIKDVKADLVINATLPRFFLKIMRATLESGANYMDMATDIGVANSRAGDRNSQGTYRLSARAGRHVEKRWTSRHGLLGRRIRCSKRIRPVCR